MTANDIEDVERELQMPYDPFDRVRAYIFVMLGDVNTNDVNNSATNQLDLTCLHVVYLFLASLLLQSLLVAMMSETYSRERENEGFAMWWMYHAGVVLCHERQLKWWNKAGYLRHRLGECGDLDPGQAHSECRPFFDISVIGGHLMDSGMKKDHALSTNFLLRKFLDNFDGNVKTFKMFCLISFSSCIIFYLTSHLFFMLAANQRFAQMEDSIQHIQKRIDHGGHDLMDSEKITDHALTTNFQLRKFLENSDGNIKRFKMFCLISFSSCTIFYLTSHLFFMLGANQRFAQMEDSIQQRFAQMRESIHDIGEHS